MHVAASCWTAFSAIGDAVDERGWLTGDDPRRMLEFLHGRASDRKLRLFQVACCRRAWHLLSNNSCREAVLVAERYADGQAKDRERRAIRNQVARSRNPDSLLAINARSAVFAANEKTSWRGLCFLGVAAVFGHAAHRTGNRGSAAYKTAYQAELRAEADLVRCIFGNPFRPSPPIDPSVLAWNGGTVPRLAASAYEDHLLPSGHLEPSRLAVLADALEEAGCTEAGILEHLRGPGLHVRGCHVIDLLVGRSEGTA
jgi:hypothetical protein